MAIHKKYTIRGNPDASMVDQIDEMLEDLYRGLNSDPLSRSDILPVDLGDTADVTGTLPLANLENLGANQLVGADTAGAPVGINLSTDFDIAGGSLVLSGAASAPWSRVFKGNDTSRNNNTLTADPDLVVPVVSGKVFVLRGYITMTADATPDIKIRFTGPGMTSLLASITYTNTFATSGTNALSHRGLFNAWDTADQVLNGAGAAQLSRGVVYINATFQPSASGNVQLEWAQNTSTAGQPSTVHQGSYLEYRQLN